MLTPREIDNLVEEVGERYDRLQDLLMSEIVRKVRKGLDIGASISWDTQTFLSLGGAWKPDVRAEIMKQTGLAEKEVDRLMKKAGLESIKKDNTLLPANHRLANRYTDNQLRIIRAGIKNVDGYIKNIANVTEGSTLELFGDLISDGYAMLSSGGFTVDQAVRRVGKKLVDTGVSGAIYPSGRHDKLEVAVRRALRTSMNQTMLTLGEENAAELGTDLVEVTAHAGARPAHAAWQGKVYSLSGKDKKYPKLSTATGYGTITGLGGVNCRHNFYPFFPDVSERMYSERKLKTLKEESVTVDGEKMTLYDAEQRMRALEREVRQQKRLQKFAGEDTRAKQHALNRHIRSLSEQTGIRVNRARTEVYGEGA